MGGQLPKRHPLPLRTDGKPKDWEKRYADACRALQADSDPDKSLIKVPAKSGQFSKPRLVKATSKRLLAEAEKYAPKPKPSQGP